MTVGTANEQPFVQRIAPALGLTVGIAVGLVVALLGALDIKFQIAAVLGVLGFGALCLLPERRIACVVLWILIHPLSIEKVLWVHAPLRPEFIDQNIVFNASDVILWLLLLFMLLEAAFTQRKVFRWSEPATVFLLFFTWAAVSLGIHVVFLQDGFTATAPLAMLRYFRLLLFMLVLQSSIRTRGEVIVVLLAIAFIIAVESALVALSYATGEVYNFARLAGAELNATLQTYSSSGGEVLQRATGTAGQTNQQASFHTFWTVPLIGLLAVRSGLTRFVALAVICASTLAIVLTFSRSAWLSFALAIMICMTIAYRRRLLGKVAWLTGAVLAVVFAGALGVLAPKIYERIAHGDEGATASRLRMLSLAVDLFRIEPIIGVGPGEYQDAALKIFPPGYRATAWLEPGEEPTEPGVGRLEVAKAEVPGGPEVIIPVSVHNKYMLTAAELGVPGLLLLLWLYAAFARSALRCSRSSDRLFQFVGIGGLAVVAASLAYMALDLFDDDKTMEFLLFIPVFITAAARCCGPLRRNPAAAADPAYSTPMARAKAGSAA